MQDMKKASGKNSEGSLSASRRVYLDLRKKITEMTLLPGTRIVERDIAAEHGTSRTPVHEAVQRLAEEGLIEVTQRVGTFVARIPLDQLEEAMLVRTALESAIIDRAAARITPEGLDRLRRIIADQHVSVDGLDYQGFHNGDEDFHGSPRRHRRFARSLENHPAGQDPGRPLSAPDPADSWPDERGSCWSTRSLSMLLKRV